MAEYILKNRNQTKKLGAKIASNFCFRKNQNSKALIFALCGELGSGKTTFAQGFLKKLGVKSRIISPTFIIFKPYRIKNKYFKNVYHADFYRLKNLKDLGAIGFKEMLKDSSNIILVEWAEKVKKAMPKNTRRLTFCHGARENERIVNFLKI